jgi:hypothetical protein
MQTEAHLLALKQREFQMRNSEPISPEQARANRNLLLKVMGAIVGVPILIGLAINAIAPRIVPRGVV